METDLAKLRELEAKATKAPWEYRDEWEAEAATRPFWIENFADLKLACALRNAAPALLARREDIRAEVWAQALGYIEARAKGCRSTAQTFRESGHDFSADDAESTAASFDQVADHFRALAREAGKGENDGR